MPITLLLAQPDLKTQRHLCLGGVHKLRLQDLAFLTTYPPPYQFLVLKSGHFTEMPLGFQIPVG